MILHSWICTYIIFKIIVLSMYYVMSYYIWNNFNMYYCNVFVVNSNHTSCVCLTLIKIFILKRNFNKMKIFILKHLIFSSEYVKKITAKKVTSNMLHCNIIYIYCSPLDCRLTGGTERKLFYSLRVSWYSIPLREGYFKCLFLPLVSTHHPP